MTTDNWMGTPCATFLFLLQNPCSPYAVLCTSIPRVEIRWTQRDYLSATLLIGFSKRSRCLWCHGRFCVHDAKIATRRWEAIIESTCEGPREKRPKYKDLALQQPPKNLTLFLLRCVQRSQVSPKALLIPFPFLSYRPPLPSSTPRTSLLLQTISSEEQAGLALNQSILGQFPNERTKRTTTVVV